jgi:hypothetical protein
LRERTENGPVPTGLERRKIQVGKTEREYFINIPQLCQDKPSPGTLRGPRSPWRFEK